MLPPELEQDAVLHDHAIAAGLAALRASAAPAALPWPPAAGPRGAEDEELWREVVVWWPGNFELPWVCAIRMLNRALAHALRYRVYAHTPSTSLFVRELRLLMTYNTRFTVRGQLMYARVVNMTYSRMFELNRPIYPQANKQTDLHRELLAFYTQFGVLLPVHFAGFLARLNHGWAKYYIPRRKYAPLEEQFTRIHEGKTLAADGWDAVVADQKALARAIAAETDDSEDGDE